MGYKPKKRGSFPKPKRQKPAAPPVRRDPQVKAAFEALQGTPAPGYWDGMTESQWSEAAIKADDSIYRFGEKPRWNPVIREKDLTPRGIQKNTGLIRQHFPEFPREEVQGFSEYAHITNGRNFPTKHHDIGVPHAAASESLIQTAYEQSGVDVEKLNLGRVDDTDLFLPKSGQYVDVQDMMINPGEGGISLGVLHRLDRYSGIDAWKNAAPTDTLEDIMNRILADNNTDLYETADKVMQDGVNTQFKKDLLVGSVRNKRVIRNAMGRRGSNKGSFLRKVGSSEYALDLNQLRPELLKATKSQLEAMRANPGGSVLVNDDKKLKLFFDLKKLQKGTKQQGLITTQFSDDVLKSLDEVGKSTPLFEGSNKMIRDRYTTSFHGGIPEPWVKGLKTNWRGGVGATVLNGASREAGVKLGQGDYAGAATEFGTTYGLGAAFEHGVKGLTKSLGKRAPGIVTRFAGGTSGSGGLLGPVMATVAAVEVADGIVEGVTGKDTIAHVNDGIVKPYYQRTTGDTRSEEQIQANLSGPKRVFGSDKPKQTKPQLSKEAVARASAHLTKMVPEVSPEPPTPTVTATVKPTAQPVKARGIAGAWRRRRK